MTRSADYYLHEDGQTTQADALATWDATVRSLAGIAPEVAEKVNLIGGKLREVWDAAEVRDDQQTLALVGESWAQIEEMATKAVMLDGGLQTAKDVVGVLARELDRVDADLAELERAVEAVDRRDDRVDDLVERVREETVDEMESDMVPYYIESVFDEMHFHITSLTGIRDFMTIARFFDALQGEHPLDDQQVFWLTQLVDSFSKEGERR